MGTVRGRRQLELARHHGRKALLVGIRKLAIYIADPETKVDDVFLKSLRLLADRVGLPAVVEQRGSLDASMTMVITAEQITTLLRQNVRDLPREIQQLPIVRKDPVVMLEEARDVEVAGIPPIDSEEPKG
jgi:hypothetical protein